MAILSASLNTQPENATALLMLDDGQIIWGYGLGSNSCAIGELCFNTAITGYQEIMSDPSYAQQIINFTFPHIGNTGTNDEDEEANIPYAKGMIIANQASEPSNYRSTASLDRWLKRHSIPAIAGVDTRLLTQTIRNNGAPNGALCVSMDKKFDLDKIKYNLKNWPGIINADLASIVSCKQPYDFNEQTWQWNVGFPIRTQPKFKVVAIDYGIKRNILRLLNDEGCDITVVPADEPAEAILARKPDGIFLSNGPGDPAATGAFAIPIIQKLFKSNIPMFGICLGQQLMALALGAKTKKMHLGHHGANHPVFDYTTQKVEITSQNHGFIIDESTLPDHIEITHRSLFDQTVAGFAVKDKPIFCVQYHPEASPGPQESKYLFQRFSNLMSSYHS